ncbi:MAG: EamA family transporter [Planctomycetota bacterium]
MLPRSRARFELVAAAALFSTGGAAIKACHVSGWQVGGGRSAIAVVAFWLLVREARRVPSPRELLVACAYGACLVSFVLANKLTTAADAIFLQAAAPLYILLLAPFLLGERNSKRELVFMAVLALGLALFFVEQLIGGSTASAQATAPDPWLGRWVGLASGVAWALTMIGLRWLSARGARPGSSASAVLLGNAIAALVCLPFALPIGMPETRDVLLLVFLGVFQIAVAYRFVTRAMREIPAFEAAVLLLVEPAFSPLWAWLVHGERPSAWTFAGGAVIVGATIVKTWLDARVPTANVASAS